MIGFVKQNWSVAYNKTNHFIGKIALLIDSKYQKHSQPHASTVDKALLQTYETNYLNHKIMNFTISRVIKKCLSINLPSSDLKIRSYFPFLKFYTKPMKNKPYCGW